MKIAMVVYAHYSRDARVRKYTESLARKNHQIDVICLKEKYLPKQKNIRLVKYPFSRKRINLGWYLIEYIFFFIYTTLVISLLFPFRKYKLIHINNMPDFLVFAAIIPKLFGSKVILDMHDPMPELFMSKYILDKNNRIVSVLFFLEKISLSFADLILTASEEFKTIFNSRHKIEAGKIIVIMNCPDKKIFKPVKRSASANFTLLYMGTVEKRFGLDIAVAAMPELKKKIPKIKFLIIPKIKDEGRYLFLLKQQISDLKAGNYIKITNPMPLEEIVKIASQCDIGLTLAKNGVFTEKILPVKLLEFIALKKPVIATRTRSLARYFSGQMLYFLVDNTPDEFVRAVYKIYSNRGLKESLIANSQKFFEIFSWAKEEEKYLHLVKILSAA